MQAKFNKHTHIEPGLCIKVILCPFGLSKSENNLWNLIPGSIHTITDRPNRRSRRNGDMGVWVDGIVEPSFIRFHTWIPYVVPKMVRKAKPVVMTRTIKPAFTRSK